MTDFIPVDECIHGGIYRIHSRNLAVGVFNREDYGGGFIGIRKKFDHEYLFSEYHHDISESMGTVRPLELVGEIDQDRIVIKERIGRPWCSRCGEFVTQEMDPETRKVSKRYHLKIPGHPAPIDCPDSSLDKPIYSSYAARQNDKLFYALYEIEQEIGIRE